MQWHPSASLFHRARTNIRGDSSVRTRTQDLLIMRYVVAKYACIFDKSYTNTYRLYAELCMSCLPNLWLQNHCESHVMQLLSSFWKRRSVDCSMLSSFDGWKNPEPSPRLSSALKMGWERNVEYVSTRLPWKCKELP